MTFHSNLIVSDVFINKGVSLYLCAREGRHLSAVSFLHHAVLSGLSWPLLIHCFPFTAWGALWLPSKQVGWRCSAFAPVSACTSHKIMMALCLSSFL